MLKILNKIFNKLKRRISFFYYLRGIILHMKSRALDLFLEGGGQND